MVHWPTLQHLGMGNARLTAPGIIDRLIAAAVLALASVAIRFTPFRVLMKSAEWGRVHDEPGRVDWIAASRLASAVESASRRLPWRTVCFQKALALQWLLRWRGIPSVLHFGISQGEERLSAHVWVSLEGTILIGEASADSHAEVATFPGRGGMTARS